MSKFTICGVLCLISVGSAFAGGKELGWRDLAVQEPCTKATKEDVMASAKLLASNALDMLVTYSIRAECRNENPEMLPNFHPSKTVESCKAEVDKAIQEKIAAITPACANYCGFIGKKLVETAASVKMRGPLSQWRNTGNAKEAHWHRSIEFIGKCE